MFLMFRSTVVQFVKHIISYFELKSIEKKNQDTFGHFYRFAPFVELC